MALNPRQIKEKHIDIDKGVGEAILTITLHSKKRNEKKTKISTKDIVYLIENEDVKILDTIRHDNISNKFGEVTGTWIFKIPTIDPEHSTSTVLRRKEKKEIVEDWGLGLEE
jgi:hypothetical protein